MLAVASEPGVALAAMSARFTWVLWASSVTTAEMPMLGPMLRIRLNIAVLFEDGLLLRLLPWMIPSGFLAVLAGWFTTEIGRQPWLVYGLFRTALGASRLEAHQVVTSLTGFAVVYTVVFGAGLYYVARLLGRGIVLDGQGPAGEPGQLQQPKRPLSALDRGVDAGGPAAGG